MAAIFNASNEYLSTTAVSGSVSTSSACFWLRLDSTQGSVINLWRVASSGNTNWQGVTISSDGVTLRASTSTGSSTGGYAASVDTWVHVGWTRSSNVHRLYINGVEATTRTSAVGITPAIMVFGGDGTNAVNGAIKEARFWQGVALSAAEFVAEKDSTTPVKTDSLWGAWPLTNNATDTSGNSRNLTVNNSVTWESSENQTLTVEGVTTDAPVVDSLTLAILSNLTASDVTTGAPSLASLPLVQKHTFTISNLSSGAPDVPGLVFSQASHLSVDDNFEVGAPSVPSLAFNQIHILVGSEVTTTAPTVPNIEISQNITLTAFGFDAGIPVVDSSVLTQRHFFFPFVVTASAPILDTPELDEIFGLQAQGIDTSAVDVPVIEFLQVHNFYPENLDTGAVDIQATQLGDFLIAFEVITGAPEVEIVSLVQFHILVAAEVTTGLPSFVNPPLSQLHIITASGITTGPPTFGQPSLSGSVVLEAFEVSTGAPTIDAPLLLQNQNLTALEVVAGLVQIPQNVILQHHILIAAILNSGVPTVGTGNFSSGLRLNDMFTFIVPDGGSAYSVSDRRNSYDVKLGRIKWLL